MMRLKTVAVRAWSPQELARREQEAGIEPLTEATLEVWTLRTFMPEGGTSWKLLGELPFNLPPLPGDKVYLGGHYWTVDTRRFRDGEIVAIEVK